MTIIHSQKRNETIPLIHFDATGKIISNPTEDNKRVYLYSAVISVPGINIIVPIFEMITSK